jgi:hypothetical protein
MKLARFIELTLVDFVPPLISHNSHKFTATLKFTAKLITVLVAICPTFFLPINKRTNISLALIKVLQSTLLFQTLAPSTHEGARIIFKCSPAILESIFPRALVYVSICIPLKDTLTLRQNFVIKRPEVNSIGKSLLAHDELIIFPDARYRLSIRFLVESLTFLNSFDKITAV